MRLTQFSDYALRVLMYAGVHDDRLITIAELAEFHGISQHHLTKVVQHLANAGYLQSLRGRGGGLRLARPAQDISIGEVLRGTEEDFRLVECFDAATDACVLSPRCRLARALHTAVDAFFAPLDALTLAELLPQRNVRKPPAVAVVAPPRSRAAPIAAGRPRRSTRREPA